MALTPRSCRHRSSRFRLPTILLLVGLASGNSLFAESAREKPMLDLDSGGHTDMIMAVAFTPDGKQVISAAKDKTVRIWDLASGQTVQTLYLPAGNGEHGALNSLVLSSDGKTLAVGGAGPADGDNPVYLISLPEGHVRHVLTGLATPVFSVAISPDGKVIAAGSEKGEVRLWNAGSGELIEVLDKHHAKVTGVVFAEKGANVATAGSNGSAYVWDVASGAVTAELTGHTKQWLHTIICSPDGKLLCTSQAGTLRFWRPNGDLVQTCTNLGDDPRAVAFSPDGKQVLCANYSSRRHYEVYLYDRQTESKSIVFNGHTGRTWDGAVSPDGKLAVTAGHLGEELFVWNTANGEPVYRLCGQGRTVWATAWRPDGKVIAWGNEGWYGYQREQSNEERDLQHAFQFGTLEQVPVPAEHCLRAKTELGTLSLKQLNSARLAVYDAGQQIAVCQERACCCFTLLPKDRVALGTSFGLYLFDARTGQRIYKFQGHTGNVWAVAPTADGRFLASAGEDQTVRIWVPGHDEPLVSLFFAGNEWIAWTPQGYYAASPGGEKLMGWRLNNGPDQMASFYAAAQFHKSLYRPDVIKLLLEAGSVEKALEIADAARGKTSAPVEVADVLPPEVRITSPVNSRVTITEPTLEVGFSARPVGKDPITAVRLFVDGRPFPGSEFYKTYDPPRANEVSEAWTFKLDPGPHTVAVQAETNASRALSDPLQVAFGRGAARDDAPAADPLPKLQLPSLYVLCVGVSQYPGKLKLDYAAGDAKALADVYREHSKPLYRKVEIKLIVDKDATRRNILQGLTWLRKQMTQNDVAVISFAGHGAKDQDGTFYLLPVDVDMDDLISTGVPGDLIKRTLTGIPGRFVLMLDACHAGAVEGQSRRGASSLTDDLVRDLATDDCGVIVMCSSMGREFSLESPEVKHGYFTLALVEGLAGKADYNHDGVVQLNELDLYVTDRVKELSKGTQHPVTARPTSIRSFPLTKD